MKPAAKPVKRLDSVRWARLEELIVEVMRESLQADAEGKAS